MASTERYFLSLHDALPISSRKLGLRRSLSRSGWRVSIELASMVAFTCDCVMSLSLRVTLPLTLVKAPLTFEIPRCRTVNWALDRKSTRLNSSHRCTWYGEYRALLSFPTRRSSDLVQEVGTAQVLVPVRLAGVDRTGVDGRVHLRLRDVLIVEGDATAYLGEGPAHVRDTKMSNGELGTRSEEHTSELQSPMYLVWRVPSATFFPYTTLFRSRPGSWDCAGPCPGQAGGCRSNWRRWSRSPAIA